MGNYLFRQPKDKIAKQICQYTARGKNSKTLKSQMVARAQQTCEAETRMLNS